MTPWHLYLMAAMYIVAGSIHFIKPKAYTSIMPSYIPAPKSMVFWSGVAEIILGIGCCFAATRSLSLWGIILMLFVFLPVHIDMISNEKLQNKVPAWFIWLRLPMQFGLMYWAYFYL